MRSRTGKTNTLNWKMPAPKTTTPRQRTAIPGRLRNLHLRRRPSTIRSNTKRSMWRTCSRWTPTICRSRPKTGAIKWYRPSVRRLRNNGQWIRCSRNHRTSFIPNQWICSCQHLADNPHKNHFPFGRRISFPNRQLAQIGHRVHKIWAETTEIRPDMEPLFRFKRRETKRKAERKQSIGAAKSER